MTKAKSATILRAPKNKRNPYTSVRRATFEDRGLSWEARGLLAYLLVKPDDWEIQVADLIDASPGGRDKVYRILNELEAHGYVEREEVRSEGKFQGVRYLLHEEPVILSDTPLPEKPDTVLPDPAKPYPEKPTRLNTNSTNNEKELKTKGREEEAAAPRPPTAPPVPSSLPDEGPPPNIPAVEVSFGVEEGPEPPPPLAPPPSPKAPTPQQALFGAVCAAIGWDYRTLSKSDRGQVADVCAALDDAGYSAEDIPRFMVEVWFKDWRWTREQARPTLKQLRQEIGKLRAKNPDPPPHKGNVNGFGFSPLKENTSHGSRPELSAEEIADLRASQERIAAAVALREAQGGPRRQGNT